MSFPCSEATVITFSTPDGKHWELFQGGDLSLLNQIPSISQASQTAPHVVLNNAGLCVNSPVPTAPVQDLEEPTLFTEIDPYQANLARLQIQRQENSGLTGGEGFGWVGVIGVGLVLLTQGEKVINRRAGRSVDAQIEAEARALVTAGHATAEPRGIPSLEASEFAGNSHEFAGNSQWPPTEFRAPYDATQPEQEGEFDCFRKYIDQDGLNPKGNDIIKQVWGASPGRSSTYKEAVKRRDAFALRLQYYRYEGR